MVIEKSILDELRNSTTSEDVEKAKNLINKQAIVEATVDRIFIDIVFFCIVGISSY